MAIRLRIVTAKSRSFQCDVAGCRMRTRYLISKRDDVMARPMHLCAGCIRGIAALLDSIERLDGIEGVRSDIPEESEAVAESAEVSDPVVEAVSEAGPGDSNGVSHEEESAVVHEDKPARKGRRRA